MGGNGLSWDADGSVFWAVQERYDTVEYNFAFRTIVADAVLSNSSWRRKPLPPWLADLCKVPAKRSRFHSSIGVGLAIEIASPLADLIAPVPPCRENNF